MKTSAEVGNASKLEIAIFERCGSCILFAAAVYLLAGAGAGPAGLKAKVDFVHEHPQSGPPSGRHRWRVNPVDQFDSLS